MQEGDEDAGSMGVQVKGLLSEQVASALVCSALEAHGKGNLLQLACSRLGVGLQNKWVFETARRRAGSVKMVSCKG